MNIAIFRFRWPNVVKIVLYTSRSGLMKKLRINSKVERIQIFYLDEISERYIIQVSEDTSKLTKLTSTP